MALEIDVAEPESEEQRRHRTDGRPDAQRQHEQAHHHRKGREIGSEREQAIAQDPRQQGR